MKKAADGKIRDDEGLPSRAVTSYLLAKTLRKRRGDQHAQKLSHGELAPTTAGCLLPRNAD